MQEAAALEGLPMAEMAEPLLQPTRQPLIGPATATRVAFWGRIAAVWLPVYVVAARAQRPDGALAASIVFGAAWYATLRHALLVLRTTLWSLGASVVTAVGAAVGLVAAAALNAILPGLRLPVGELVEMAVAVFCVGAIWESTVLGSVAARRRVLVVDAADGGSELVEELNVGGTTRFEVVGIVDDERDSDQIAGATRHGKIADLARIVEEHRPDVVVLASERSRTEAFNVLLDVAHLGFCVVGLPEFYEYAFGRLPVRNLDARWFMSILHLYQRPYAQHTKRAFDIVVASLGLLLTAPLFPILALLVRRTPGPAIYRQTRLGAAGRPFTIYKFRSMRADAEADGAVWAAEVDPRVTKIGRFMRNTRLDELPQLWNVLKGDMSIVGPRPERPEFVEELQAEVPFWTRRHLVKPGITGWAQVRRGYTSDAESTSEKLSYDLWYLRHHSLIVDLAICAKTLSTLVTGAGAR
jgi:exopolysaccharide biosynthesis polyprenyl glycosylphosphotransferase